MLNIPQIEVEMTYRVEVEVGEPRSEQEQQDIEFGVDDIVRSGLCKEYLATKLALGM